MGMSLLQNSTCARSDDDDAKKTDMFIDYNFYFKFIFFAYAILLVFFSLLRKFSA